MRSDSRVSLLRVSPPWIFDWFLWGLVYREFRSGTQNATQGVPFRHSMQLVRIELPICKMLLRDLGFGQWKAKIHSHVILEGERCTIYIRAKVPNGDYCRITRDRKEENSHIQIQRYNVPFFIERNAQCLFPTSLADNNSYESPCVC